MRMDDRLRRGLSDRADRVRVSEDEWERIAERLRGHRPRERSRKVMAALAAAAVVAAGTIVVGRAFLGTKHPLSSAPNGPIVFVGPGSDQGLGVDNTELFAVSLDGTDPHNLTGTIAAEHGAVWSPDGTRVAFLRTEPITIRKETEARTSLQVMDIDGANPRTLRTCPSDRCPVSGLAWSPDAARLAWIEGEAIVAADLERGTTVEICRKRGCGQLMRNLAWSPDGTRIAWDETGAHLGIIDIPSGIRVGSFSDAKVQVLTDSPPCSCDNLDMDPTWSPDGGTIGFRRASINHASGGADDVDQAYVIPSAGGTPRSLGRCSRVSCPPFPWERATVRAFDDPEEPVLEVREPGTDRPRRFRACECRWISGPQVSPDQRWIAFGGAPLDARSIELFMVGVDGTGLLRPGIELAQDFDSRELRWLPSSEPWRRIASGISEETPVAALRRATEPEGGLISLEADLTSGDSAWRFYQVRSDGTGFQELEDEPEALRAVGLSERGVLSPDGTRIAFSDEGIWVMNFDGSLKRSLADPALGSTGPAWSPDGSTILFERHEKAGSDLRVVDLTTGKERALTDLPGAEQDAAVSPDGNSIAFVWWTLAGSDLYVIGRDGSGLRRITEFGARSPVWSPDGSALAFSARPLFRDQALSPQWIYTMRLEDRAIFPVLDGKDWSPKPLSWRPET